jgi:SAM-dependent methyltransferase
MTEPLFDLSDEYEQMLNRGIRLSGEEKGFFVLGRIQSLLDRLPTGFQPTKVLDFGCGIGGTAAQLAITFPDAEVVGVDTSDHALAYARQTYSSSRIRFRTMADLTEESDFDLCYVNGVFHHIEPSGRIAALAGIRAVMRPGGLVALFENNSWNIGTRMVMARIPFDRDAQPISPPQARRLMERAGFTVCEAWSLFYFPRLLARLRPFERFLARLPLGAQYCVLSAR